MKIKLNPVVLALALSCASAGIASAQGVALKFKTIQVPNSLETVLEAINNSNVAAGFYLDSNNNQHGMTIAGKTVTNVDDPNGVGATVCEDVSDAGVVGGYYGTASEPVGFVEKGGTFKDVLPFGSSISVVWTINATNVIVGTYVDPNTGVVLGFYGSTNNFTSFSVPNSAGTLLAKGNDAGLIVATWVDSSGNYESSLFNPTKNTFTTINVSGATDSFAENINNNDQIVYAWEDSNGLFHGAVRSADGKFLTFDDPAGTNTEGNGINDAGIIVGDFVPTGATESQGFAATK